MAAPQQPQPCPGSGAQAWPLQGSLVTASRWPSLGSGFKPQSKCLCILGGKKTPHRGLYLKNYLIKHNLGGFHVKEGKPNCSGVEPQVLLTGPAWSTHLPPSPCG